AILPALSTSPPVSAAWIARSRCRSVSGSRAGFAPPPLPSLGVMRAYCGIGAQKRTRTSTPLRAPAPEAGASTNSAIWARGRERELGGGASLVNAHRILPRLSGGGGPHEVRWRGFLDRKRPLHHAS